MDFFILTSNPRGLASLCVPSLAKSDSNLKAVVLVKAAQVTSSKNLYRKLVKTLKIGILGALNGIRIRDWYSYEAPEIQNVCRLHNVPLLEVESLNSVQTEEVIEKLDVDIGISLSNGYIRKSVFQKPELGMINVHTELLPDYPGAQSVIWPIFDCNMETGFSIHKINAKIDKGKILATQRIPIHFKSTLAETVRYNLQRIRSEVPELLLKICNDFALYSENAQVQEQESSPHKSRTTPTISQFYKMCRNNKILWKQNK
ncbi:MAG: formyltransferase family protein [Kangiellaceae bacterium]|nr:formyltransferase family protein [Kangiellaceae bacterium]MCW9000086.1 formyltransferase family protein [Kangiellaceae bacterium]MCW9016677.1 formyltransferase family protein [Kangiellaceae bacterium]